MKTCGRTVIEEALHGFTVLLQIILLPHLYYIAFVWAIYVTRYLRKAQLLWQKRVQVYWISLHCTDSSCSEGNARQHTWSAWWSQQLPCVSPTLCLSDEARGCHILSSSWSYFFLWPVHSMSKPPKIQKMVLRPSWKSLNLRTTFFFLLVEGQGVRRKWEKLI